MDSSAIDYLVEEGYDVEYGARPLQRTIQKKVKDKLSEMILKDEIENGSNVEAYHENDDDELSFEIIDE